MTLCLALMVALSSMHSGLSFAQHGGQEHGPAADASQEHEHGHHGAAVASDGWEGSKEGVAYSEFNHHLAGLFVLLIGFSEMTQALRSFSHSWARMLLPSALVMMGTFLLIWSDHEAWPIGRLSFMQTFFGNDHEILQHKLYGIVALIVGVIEVLRRVERLTHAGWLAPLPLFAIMGGLMLFGHSHGAHPSAQKIALHHTLMGTLALSAGSSRLASGWMAGFIGWSRARWELIWSGLILLIGLQLLFYAE